MRAILLTVATCSFLADTSAAQTCTFYTDRTDFCDDAPRLNSYDFANMVPGPGNFDCCNPGRFDSTSNNGCFATGAFPTGVAFQSIQDTAGACALNVGSFPIVVCPGVSSNIFNDDDSFEFDRPGPFDPPTLAFGVELTAFTQPADTQAVDVFDESGTLICSTSGVGEGFFGVISDTPIGRITFRDNDLGGQSGFLYCNIKWGAPATVFSYCTAKTGLVCGDPVMSFSGVPEAGATSGFIVSSSPARGMKTGVIFWSCTGGAATPFQGGWLCINPQNPIGRASNIQTGGTNGMCDGVFMTDWNCFASGGGAGCADGAGDPCLQIPGQEVGIQFIGRDSPGTGSYLSAGLEFRM